MRVSVLQPSYRDSDSPLKGLDVRRDLTALFPGDEVAHLFLDKATVNRDVARLAADVVVNLCDGSWDDDTPGIDVVLALERHGRAFTGASSRFYDPSRLAMKQAAVAAGVAIPAYVIAEGPADVERALDELALPAFVKPGHGANSVGITAESKVASAEALRRQAAAIIAAHGSALVEEYVDGREYSALVANGARGPVAFRPVECVLDPALPFKTFDYKWRTSRNPWRRCDDDALAERLAAASAAVFAALGSDGYGRTDLRVAADGELVFLEINPNCSAFYPDDNAATADVILALEGRRAEFVQLIVAEALARRERRARPWRIGYDRRRGHGLYAVRAIAAGEVLFADEETPHRLVTRARVERWDPAARELFRHYAWPLSEQVHVIWPDDPEAWRPLNHGCDPNAWVDGLDLRARRAIAAGEEITFDYATMYTSGELGTACTCGAELCRGGWRGDDHRAAWFRDRYGDHVTDWVRAAMRPK